MGFRNIWVKELKSMYPLYGVYGIAVLLLHLVILYKRESLQEDTIIALSLVMPFLLVTAFSLGAGYFQLHTEWRTNTIYLLLSFPIRGWKILTAKLAAVLYCLLLALLWTGISFSLILLTVKWRELTVKEELLNVMPELIRVGLNSLWMYGLAVLFLLVLTQFTFLCGQLVARFKWVVRLAAFFGALWLVFRISPVLSQLFIWVPDIMLGSRDGDGAYLHAGPFIVLLAVCFGLTALNGYIFEKEVEV